MHDTSTFESLALQRQWLNALEDMGMQEPTPIQFAVFKGVEAGSNLIGVAPTGTGKTLAYLLPLCRKLSHAQGNDPRAMVLVPTRELALQVESTAKSLIQYTDLRVCAVYGGLGPKTQIEILKAGIDLIIATPGRWMELYLKQAFTPKMLKHLVIDEADKMMDMGFMPQLRKVFEVIPRKRQNLLFSATMPEKVERFVAEFIDFPERINITQKTMVAETIAHAVYEVPNYMSKIRLLDYLLSKAPDDRILIFARTRATAEELYKFIHRKVNESVRVIHANKGQNTRINAMDAFKSGELNFLVATDVAARGIDVEGVDMVINIDVPLIPEDYIHRVGRTGRAGKSGKAITMVAPNDLPRLQKIEQTIGDRIEVMPKPDSMVWEETPKEESQMMARDLDAQQKAADPTFKGAFHDKKRKFPTRGKSPKSTKKPQRKKGRS